MSDRDDSTPRSEGDSTGNTTRRIQIAADVPDEECILDEAAGADLVSWMEREVGDALLGLGVYNSEGLELHYHTEDRITQYTEQELEAIADDVNLAAATGDEYQEDLYIFEDLQYVLQGFGDVHQLRIRVSPTTGVFVLLDREAPLELPGFVERFTDETDPDIVGA